MRSQKPTTSSRIGRVGRAVPKNFKGSAAVIVHYEQSSESSREKRQSSSPVIEDLMAQY